MMRKHHCQYHDDDDDDNDNDDDNDDGGVHFHASTCYDRMMGNPNQVGRLEMESRTHDYMHQFHH